MDPAILQHLIPIISILAVFGMPVAIVFVIKHFKFKDRELEAELEARRMLSETQAARLEARLERLESALLARVGQALPPAASAMPAALAEPPPLSGDPFAAAPKKDPVR